jgi:hydroxymethylpyrimidine pyrophosphatase-like HAD family hydrolase
LTIHEGIIPSFFFYTKTLTKHSKYYITNFSKPVYRSTTVTTNNEGKRQAKTEDLEHLWKPGQVREKGQRPKLVIISIGGLWAQNEGVTSQSAQMFRETLGHRARTIEESLQNKIPPICFATGRPGEYIRGLLDSLGFETWASVEGGATLFHPTKMPTPQWRRIISDASKMAINNLRADWALNVGQRHPGLRYYPDKTAMLTLVLVPSQSTEINQHMQNVREDLAHLVAQNLIEITSSGEAINIIGVKDTGGSANKALGIKDLSAPEIMNVHPRDILFIGRGPWDIPAARSAGHVGCTKNATPEYERGFGENHNPSFIYKSRYSYAHGVADIIKQSCK